MRRATRRRVRRSSGTRRPSSTSSCLPGARRIAPLLRLLEPDVALCIGFPVEDPAGRPCRAQATPSSTAIPRSSRAIAVRARSRGRSGTARPEIGFTLALHGRRARHGARSSPRDLLTLDDEHSWEELEPKLVPVVGELLTGALERVEAGDPGDPQDESQATTSRSSARLRLDRPVQLACRGRPTGEGLAVPLGDVTAVRGALAEIDGETVRVLRTSRDPAEGRALECADGTLWIVETRAAHEAGDRSHVVRAGCELGGVARFLLRSSRSRTSMRSSVRAVVPSSSHRPRTDVEETLAALDGIVFSGGADVDPARYGADAHPETDTPQTRRDAGELALAAGGARAGPADARDLPWIPAAERRAWGRPRPAPARAGRERRPQAGAGRVRRASGRGEGGLAARRRSSVRAPR